MNSSAMGAAITTKCPLLLTGVLLLAAHSASATGAGPVDLTGLLAVLVLIVSIVPLVLLEWAIVRARAGKSALYLGLPAFIFIVMLIASIIAGIYQGHFLNIDGAALVVALAWTGYRTLVFLNVFRAKTAPTGDA